MSDPPEPRRYVWLVIREDEPGRGEWFAREREASLKATWLRDAWKARVRVVRTCIDDGTSASAPPRDAASERGPGEET